MWTLTSCVQGEYDVFVDPFEDQFEKRAKDKSERVAKNEYQRLRNLAKSQDTKITGLSVYLCLSDCLPNCLPSFQPHLPFPVTRITNMRLAALSSAVTIVVITSFISVVIKSN